MIQIRIGFPRLLRDSSSSIYIYSVNTFHTLFFDFVLLEKYGISFLDIVEPDTPYARSYGFKEFEKIGLIPYT